MRTTFAAFTVVIAIALPGGTAHATPPVLEPTATLTVPDASYESVTSVALDGNDLLMAATRTGVVPPETLVTDGAVFLFRREPNGQWQFARTLWAETVFDFGFEAKVAMRGNLIAIQFDRLAVFERTASGWQRSAVDSQSEQPGNGSVNAHDVEIDGTTIVIGTQEAPGSVQGFSTLEARAFRKNASGTWVRVGTASSEPASNASLKSDVAISGNTTLLPAQLLADGTSASYVLEGAPSNWTNTARINRYAWPVAIHQDLAIFTGMERNAGQTFPTIFQRSAGVWTRKQALQRADSLLFFGLGPAELHNKLAVVSYGRSVSVYQGDATNTFSEFARLVRPGANQDERPFTGNENHMAASWVDISGRRIAVNDLFVKQVYVYDLPTTIAQPATIQQTFETGSSARWTPLAGSSWAVAASGGSRVYRQSSVAGLAGSFVNSMDWQDQSIQADIKPTAFAAGNDRWFGLAVRRTDDLNYYYLTARSTNVLQLKKMVNGAFQTLASTGLGVALNTPYRLRLEAIGTTLRAYVDDRLALQLVDASLTRGQAGLLMFKAAVDYDNVVASPSPQVTLVNDNLESFNGFRWTRVSGQWSVSTNYVQTSTAGNATLLTGISTRNQSVQASLLPGSFSSGDVRWCGLFARYRDSGNYYYVTLRNNNQISLRKLVGSVVQVLDSAPLPVTSQTLYRVRLEAIQNELRVYVDGRLVLEATDTSHPWGRYGAITFKAAASYDDVLVTQP